MYILCGNSPDLHKFAVRGLCTFVNVCQSQGDKIYSSVHSPFGWLFTSGIFCKVKKQINFWSFSLPPKLRNNFAKNAIGLHFGRFLTNASGHPGQSHGRPLRKGLIFGLIFAAENYSTFARVGKQGDRGPMLWFLKYFRRKIRRKNSHFWLKTKLYYANFDHYIVFEKNANILPKIVENLRKLWS
jgi:hypothetical protein